MEKLIQHFPKINKINYEIVNHLKNVKFDDTIYMYIPKGPKMFAWFTYYNNQCICLFYNQEQDKIFTKYVSFKDELSLGTILYGTLIDNYFVCETIHYYKNEIVGGNFITKINLIKDLLKTSIKDSEFHSISFKLPQMSNANITSNMGSKLLLECSNLPYHVYGILQIENRPKMLLLHNLFGNFNIKKDSLEDVYNLYTLYEKNQLSLYSTALVNDFKTSHFLKKLFRIKTTYKNVEFSDEDDEIKDLQVSKEIWISCIYIQEFKKWKPYVSKFSGADSTKTIVFKEKKNIAL